MNELRHLSEVFVKLVDGLNILFLLFLQSINRLFFVFLDRRFCLSVTVSSHTVGELTR